MSSIEQAGLGRINSRSDSMLSPDEFAFLESVRVRLDLVLEQKHGFQIAIHNIARDLVSFVASRLQRAEYRSAVDVYSLRETTAGLLTENFAETTSAVECEEDFCRDAIAMIDYVERNGIGFWMSANVLSHDLDAIIRGNGLPDQIRRGFSPKVSGWRNSSKESVGTPDEPEE